MDRVPLVARGRLPQLECLVGLGDSMTLVSSWLLVKPMVLVSLASVTVYVFRLILPPLRYEFLQSPLFLTRLVIAMHSVALY